MAAPARPGHASGFRRDVQMEKETREECREKKSEEVY
jgi:hypothetical protein